MECLVGCKRDGKLARDDCAVRVDRLYSTVCSAILVRQQKLFVVRAPCARCARFEAAIMCLEGIVRPKDPLFAEFLTPQEGLSFSGIRNEDTNIPAEG